MLRKHIVLVIAVIFVVGCLSSLPAQTTDTSMKPTIVIGEVTAIDPAKITLQTKDGALEVALVDKTEYKRISAEKPSLSSATASSLSNISVGDKVAISVIFGADKKPQPARTVYLMTKTDIAQKQNKDTEEWRTRGITGRVVAIDQLAGKITLAQPGLMGNMTNVVITPKENATYLRYAPNSFKFSEAKESNITEIKTGDNLRAVGDRGADGTTFTAEKLLSGAFQTRAGKVKSIDTAKNEVVVTDLQSEKDLTIAIIPTSILKKYPEEMAQRMAQFQMGGGQGGFRPAGGGNNPGGAPQPGAGATPGQGAPGQGRMFGGRGGGIDDMLDRFPTITVADLKVGDVIAVSSTKNGDLDHITAIKLLSGVEPFIQMAQRVAAAQQGNGPRRQLDLNIPGLDGFGTP
jgi:hypothetical protein